MKSVMQHSFAQVPKAEIQRSSFDRSHGFKTTFDAGKLVPIFVDEALPGDTFNLRMAAFARLATPLKPIMDNLFLETFFFAVPYRLVWDNWQKFNGEQRDPGDSTDFLIPQVVAPGVTGVQVGELHDYFGVPTGVPSLSFSALFGRAYNLIYNEWFRDQNLQPSSQVLRDDGPDPYSNYVLLNRSKRHDYFTSCLPWPQKGPDVLLPLGVSAPIDGIGNLSIPGFDADLYKGAARTGGSAGSNLVASTGPNDLLPVLPYDGDMFINTADQNIPFSTIAAGLTADLTDATAATINSIREAFQIQRLYERDARGGTRYTEILRSHFGVVSPDARLQRPEYLGGGSSPINIHPVAQTAAATDDSPQANLAAFGTVAPSGHGFSKSFVEHCLIIGLVNVRADLTYQQGLNRMWSRRTRWDFYWPALSHLGEQAVLNKEIYAQANSDDDLVFGYQERFAEYRYKPSLITGEFRSQFAQSLDIWHLSQDFGALPTLGQLFMYDDPPIDRVIAVPSEPHFLFDSYFNLRCARPMPVYGVPGLVDHF